MTAIEVTHDWVAAWHTKPLQTRQTRAGLSGRLVATFALRDCDPNLSPLPQGERVGAFGPVIVVKVSSSGPLELRRPVMADHRFLLRNVTAGVFGGDFYEAALTCEAGARACVESTSAKKVYAMPGTGATSRVRLTTETGGCLVWGPHTTILLGGSEYASEIEVVLAGGVVIVAETVAMGRLASGEAFAYRRYDSSLTVRDEAGTVSFAEHATLVPSATLRDAMGARGALTTMYALGVELDEEVLGRLTEITQSHELAGWSALPNRAGLVMKALVDSASEGETLARALLAEFRKCL